MSPVHVVDPSVRAIVSSCLQGARDCQRNLIPLCGFLAQLPASVFVTV